MSSIHEIRNIHIFNHSSREIRLCRRHQDELCQSVAEKLKELVASRLFQTKFKEFFPSAQTHETAHVRVHITGNEVSVQKIDENGRAFGAIQRANLLDTIEGLDDPDIDEAESINKNILRKANTIYQHHLRENGLDRGESEHRGPSSYRNHEENTERAALQPDANSDEPSDQASEPANEIDSNAPHADRATPEQRGETVVDHRAELEEMQRRKTELEQQLERVNAENARLRASAPGANIPIQAADHDQLVHLARALSSEELSSSPHFRADLKGEFLRLPENIRHAIYYQTYLLVDPLEASDPWPIGQRLFEGEMISDSALNICRAQVISHFLMQTLAGEFADAEEWKTPPEELLRRFNQLPKENRDAVYTQLEFIQPKGYDYRGASHAFFGSDHLSVTNQERGIAVHRALTDSIAEYHRHHYRERIRQMEILFQRFQEQARRATGQG